MANANPPDTIAVLLSEKEPPRVATLVGAPTSRISIAGCIYRDKDVPEWLGFYDWLRSESDELVGVRLWLDDPMSSLQPLRECMGVNFRASSELLVFFGTSQAYDASRSDDQDFGGNWLFESEEGYALCFHAPHDHRRRLQSASAA